MLGECLRKCEYFTIEKEAMLEVFCHNLDVWNLLVNLRKSVSLEASLTS